MTKKLKKRIKRLVIGTIPFVIAILMSFVTLPNENKLNQ